MKNPIDKAPLNLSHANLFHANLFHEGEIALQQSVGMAERMAQVGAKVVRDFMPDQHRDFYARLPYIVAASVDDAGDVWPTFLTGEPGFITSPSPTALTINAKPASSDPAFSGMASGNAIGLLGIELHTRRRNRMNGTIERASSEALEISVGHSFGNCPQYIQLRDFEFVDDAENTETHAAEISSALTPEARAMILSADTFFVASYVEREDERQVDASHRGGRPGFVRIEEDGLLTIPDFSGNFHFNTLGNFMVNPRAGLLFVDFTTGDTLQIAGAATVITDIAQIEAFEGAQRFWTFRPSRVILRKGALPLRWQQREEAFSAKTLRTGLWGEVRA